MTQIETIATICIAVSSLLLIVLAITSKDTEIKILAGIFGYILTVLYVAVLFSDLGSETERKRGYKDCLANNPAYTYKIKYIQKDSVFIPTDTVITYMPK